MLPDSNSLVVFYIYILKITSDTLHCLYCFHGVISSNWFPVSSNLLHDLFQVFNFDLKLLNFFTLHFIYLFTWFSRHNTKGVLAKRQPQLVKNTLEHFNENIWCLDWKNDCLIFLVSIFLEIVCIEPTLCKVLFNKQKA